MKTNQAFVPFDYTHTWSGGSITATVVAVQTSTPIVHLAKRYEDGRYSRCLCGSGDNTVGTRKRSRIHLAPEGVAITCKKCLKKLADLEARRDPD